MIELEESASGVRLPVQAQPKARKNGLVGTHDGRLKVAVTQAPEKGKANDALVKILASVLGLRRSQIEIISGATSSKKTFLITGIKLQVLQRRLDDCLNGTSTE